MKIKLLGSLFDLMEWQVEKWECVFELSISLEGRILACFRSLTALAYSLVLRSLLCTASSLVTLPTSSPDLLGLLDSDLFPFMNSFTIVLSSRISLLVFLCSLYSFYNISSKDWSSISSSSSLITCVSILFIAISIVFSEFSM